MARKVSVSLLHFVSPCFVTSTDLGVWTVSSCFRVFPIYLIRFICYETEMGLLKKYICFIVSYRFALFRNKHWPWFLVCYILFQSFLYISRSLHLFETEMGWKIYFLAKKSISVTSCFRVLPIYLNRFICYETEMGFEQVFWSVTSCFRVFPIYLNRFICYETKMGL